MKTQGIEEILAKKLHALETDWSDGCYIRSEDVDAICDYLHQELQKARHDWLREEIVKLEGMRITDLCEDHDTDLYEREVGYNQALQTIIDRYQSELDQPTPAVYKE